VVVHAATGTGLPRWPISSIGAAAVVGDLASAVPVDRPTDDHPLSTRHMDETAYRADPPTGVSRHPRGRDEDLIDNAGYDGDAPEQHNNLGDDPYPGRYASNE
jgi:hypothetical protein